MSERVALRIGSRDNTHRMRCTGTVGAGQDAEPVGIPGERRRPVGDRNGDQRGVVHSSVGTARGVLGVRYLHVQGVNAGRGRRSRVGDLPRSAVDSEVRGQGVPLREAVPECLTHTEIRGLADTVDAEVLEVEPVKPIGGMSDHVQVVAVRYQRDRFIFLDTVVLEQADSGRCAGGCIDREKTVGGLPDHVQLGRGTVRSEAIGMGLVQRAEVIRDDLGACKSL